MPTQTPDTCRDPRPPRPPAARRDAALSGVALFGVALFGVVMLAGCKEEKKTATPAATPAAADRVVQATEQNIRAGRAFPVTFRGVLAWTQAAPQKWAVCGQMTPFQDSPDLFVPFVSVATVTTSADDQVTQYQFEHRIGATSSEASRVYAALVAHCYDRGGPAAGAMRGAPSPPPLPDAVADPRAPAASRPDTAKAAALRPADTARPAPPADTARPADATAASGEASMRQAANLRADPQGPTIRVLPQGMPLHIFGQAPGGWLQVGDTAPWGWVHESMLTRKAP